MTIADVGKLDVLDTFDNDDFDFPATLPDPSNSWYLVIYPMSIKNVIKGAGGTSFILPDTATATAESLMTVGLVVRKGAMCYKWNQYKNPETGEYMPWCDVGDWVVFGRDSNARAVVHQNKKFWILPDEAILYRVKSPNEIDKRYEVDEEMAKKLAAKVKEMNNV